MSRDFIKTLEKEWSKEAKEPIKVKVIKDVYYAYGSELATLRLFRYFVKYSNNSRRIDCGYSKNLQTFYFVREPI